MQIVIMILVFFIALQFGFSFFFELLTVAAMYWQYILLSMSAVGVIAGGIAYSKGRPVVEAAFSGFAWPLIAVLKLIWWITKGIFGLINGAGRTAGR